MYFHYRIHGNLLALNERFAGEKKPDIILKETPDTLKDEDLVEMVSSGLISLTIVEMKGERTEAP